MTPPKYFSGGIAHTSTSAIDIIPKTNLNLSISDLGNKCYTARVINNAIQDDALTTSLLEDTGKNAAGKSRKILKAALLLAIITLITCTGTGCSVINRMTYGARFEEGLSNRVKDNSDLKSLIREISFGTPEEIIEAVLEAEKYGYEARHAIPYMVGVKRRGKAPEAAATIDSILKKIGPNSQYRYPELIEHLSYDDDFGKIVGSMAHDELVGRGEGAIPYLIGYLDKWIFFSGLSEEDDSIDGALEVLRDLGIKAEKAVPTLVKYYTSKDLQYYRRGILSAIVGIGYHKEYRGLYFSLLRHGTKSDYSHVRKDAVLWMTKLFATIKDEKEFSSLMPQLFGAIVTDIYHSTSKGTRYVEEVMKESELPMRLVFEDYLKRIKEGDSQYIDSRKLKFHYYLNRGYGSGLKSIGDSATESLLQITENEGAYEDGYKEKAIIALGKTGDIRGIPSFLNMLKNRPLSKETKREILSFRDPVFSLISRAFLAVQMSPNNFDSVLEKTIQYFLQNFLGKGMHSEDDNAYKVVQEIIKMHSEYQRARVYAKKKIPVQASAKYLSRAEYLIKELNDDLRDKAWIGFDGYGIPPYRQAYELGQIGPVNEHVIPTLIRTLGHYDWFAVPSRSAEALGLIGKPALPDVMLALFHKDSKVRSYAMEALKAMGENALESEFIIDLLLSNAPETPGVSQAYASITKNSNKASRIVNALEYDYDGTGGGVEALVKLGPTIAPHLIRALEHKNARVRLGVVKALVDMKIEVDESMPALIKLLKDLDTKISRSAAREIKGYGKLARNYGPELVAVYSDKLDLNTRADLMWSLDEIDYRGYDLIDLAIDQLTVYSPEPIPNDLHGLIRSRSASILGKIGLLKLDKVTPHLKKALIDEDDRVRDSARKALKALNQNFSVVNELEREYADVFKLIESGQDDDQISDALANIPWEELGQLVDDLDSHQWTVREKAARTLGELKVRDGLIVRNLMRMAAEKVKKTIRHPYYFVGVPEEREIVDWDATRRLQSTAKNAIINIGLPAVPVLLGYLGDEEISAGKGEVELQLKIQILKNARNEMQKNGKKSLHVK